MKQLVIAPTATFKSGTQRIPTGSNDTIKDFEDAVVIEQKVDSIMPPNCDVSKTVVEQRIYQDMKPMNYLHVRNRQKDLYVYDMDTLYSKRPMYNVSLPEMKLRKQT